ncbi:MAG: FtsQ-type POTRA domain-containing protein [Oscillospiraceae bacterium]|nr:FtsQ-type POTRA domain-containing protein [Oscillospiraceae bacterium]
MAESNRRVQKKRKSALFTPLAFVLVCAALAFGISVFFRVTEIEVVGMDSYTPEEIIAASGIEKGDNLFFINRGGSASRIISKLPYVDFATVHRDLPNSVTIEVQESSAIAYVAVEGELWVIDNGCKALSKTTSSQTEGLIRIIGVEANKPDVGETLTGGEEEALKLAFVAEILEELSVRGMERMVGELDMQNPSDPTFTYLSRFVVKLGKNENVDYKLDRLLSVIEQLGEGDTGTLDLSIDDRVHFSQG